MNYTIEGRSVTPEAFSAFVQGLKEVKGTRYSDDRVDGGGSTGYEARHPDGRLFQVWHDSADGSSATLKPGAT
jgi:hypothetical protein